MFTASLALIFISSFCKVFIAAFQQKNVMQDRYLWVLPTSVARAAAEYVSIGLIAVTYVVADDNLQILYAILSLGLGGGIGCVISMILHNRLTKHKDSIKVS